MEGIDHPVQSDSKKHTVEGIDHPGWRRQVMYDSQRAADKNHKKINRVLPGRLAEVESNNVCNRSSQVMMSHRTTCNQHTREAKKKEASTSEEIRQNTGDTDSDEEHNREINWDHDT